MIRPLVASQSAFTSTALARSLLESNLSLLRHGLASRVRMSLLLESNLFLLRHGQSVWNSEPARFTGWCDVPLTVKGRVEAVSVGQLLRSRGFRAANVDVAFTSELQRAHETCELALASMAGHEQDTWLSERIRRDVRLNERHYGAVQGLYKDDPALRAAYGEEEIRRWRRSMLSRPPPLDETHPEWRPPPAPLTESLADCQRCEACKPASQGLHAAVRLQDMTLCRRDALPLTLPPHSLPPPSPGAWWSASRSASHRRCSTAATLRRAGGPRSPLTARQHCQTRDRKSTR